MRATLYWYCGHCFDGPYNYLLVDSCMKCYRLRDKYATLELAPDEAFAGGGVAQLTTTAGEPLFIYGATQRERRRAAVAMARAAARARR